ncbi:MAG: RluA family pseudouridine synthase [Blautia sp.]|nr:RluA family pseudouridine synthase [Blautia sp.]
MENRNIENYILYEDDDILVCHKPAGIAVQNARVGTMDLESLIKNYLSLRKGSFPYLGIIHRLDQPVEGVLVFALNSKTAGELNRQMRSGQIGKIYLAVTEGCANQKSGVLENWLKKNGKTNTSEVVSSNTPGAKKAKLFYEILDTREIKGQRQNLLRIRLDTGRHHQIRVQMAHAGMPIVGDRKYNKNLIPAKQLALCAYELDFAHPATKKKMKFHVVPFCEEFKNFQIPEE